MGWKNTQNKIQRGGLTSFETAFLFRPKEYEAFLFQFYFYLHHNLDTLAYKYDVYLLF